MAELCELPEPRDAFVDSASPIVKQLRRRQLSSVRPFYQEGLEALRREGLRRVLAGLAVDLDQRAERVRAAADSESTVPPYNKRFSGRLDELLSLRRLGTRGQGVDRFHAQHVLRELAAPTGQPSCRTAPWPGTPAAKIQWLEDERRWRRKAVAPPHPCRLWENRMLAAVVPPISSSVC